MNIFDPHVRFETITIVGCGGTGAQVARIVGRILYDMRRARLEIPRMVLIDPDHVEEKNVGRQLFTAADAALQLPKVEVVGKRLNMALGLDVAWFAEPVQADRHFGRNTMIISCVDNHLARRVLQDVDGILIGAGNYRDGGQVVIGNTSNAEFMRDNLDGDQNGRYRYLPKEGLLFPALLEPETPAPQLEPELSCADLVLRGEQDVLINDWIAVVVGQYVAALLHRQPITTFATFINSTSMSVRSLPICHDELLPYLSEDQQS